MVNMSDLEGANPPMMSDILSDEIKEALSEDG